MHAKLLFFALITSLLLSSRLLAVAEETLIHYEIRLEDNPKPAHAWARQTLASINPDQEPARYLRTLWLGIEINNPESKPLIALLPSALVLAEKLGWKEEWFRLKMHALRAERWQKKMSKDPAYFESLIADARRLNIPRMLARILFDYAFHLDAKGDLNASLRLQDEAYHILRTAQLSAFDQTMLTNEMAVLLIQQGQSERALPMLEAVAAYCEKEQVRAFAAIALYNLARQYDLKQTAADARIARTWFQKAYTAAAAIQDEESRASAHYGLGSAALTLRDWPDASVQLQAALKLFRAQDDSYWIAETLLLVARNQRLQGHAHEALPYLLEALPLVSSDDQRLRSKIEEELAKTYQLTGDSNQAVIYLNRTLEASRRLFEQQQHDDYQRRTVQLGLRVEEERNKVLQRENELQSQKLKQAQLYRLYFFVVCILLLGLVGFISVAIIQTLRVRHSKEKMREILDHIEEGILTFDRNLHIEAEYSAFLREFTQTQSSLQGQSILSTLIDRADLHAEEKSMLREVLHITLGEERLSWELNEAQLPRLLNFADRSAALHWVPMFDGRGHLNRILLTLRDISQEKRLSARIEQQEERERQLHAKVRELLEAPIPSVLSLLGDIDRRFDQKPAPDARRSLHTFKGIARSLGLKSLSQSIHALESDPDSSPLWNAFFDQTTQYRLLISDHSQARTHRNLSAVVAELLPAFLDAMQKAQCPVEGCTIDDQILVWPERLLSDLKNILVHVLSNCADHGFIRPRHRTPARLLIQAKRQGGHIQLHIRDNGVGLDRTALQAAASAQRFQPKDSETIFDVVFLEGFSTATETRLTSGRGVGLAAVAAICRNWQGEAHIAPDPDLGGTHMELSFKQPA